MLMSMLEHLIAPSQILLFLSALGIPLPASLAKQQGYVMLVWKVRQNHPIVDHGKGPQLPCLLTHGEALLTPEKAKRASSGLAIGQLQCFLIVNEGAVLPLLLPLHVPTKLTHTHKSPFSL